jgi:hypothetical protein
MTSSVKEDVPMAEPADEERRQAISKPLQSEYPAIYASGIKGIGAVLQRLDIQTTLDSILDDLDPEEMGGLIVLATKDLGGKRRLTEDQVRKALTKRITETVSKTSTRRVNDFDSIKRSRD